MRLVIDRGSLYLTAGPVFHKCLETGFQRLRENEGINVGWRFRTRGDHAGLSFNVEFFGFMFEFNVYDHRHWDYDNNTWQVYEHLK